MNVMVTIDQLAVEIERLSGCWATYTVASRHYDRQWYVRVVLTVPEGPCKGAYDGTGAGPTHTSGLTSALADVLVALRAKRA